ncbi:MAG: cobalt-precorrin-5B (C(1))-methyltransferase CbiD [Tepidanaerobacteraceae bacterium]|jgi:cobalt-precorrin-5B (C1)-methyltransferase|nr:cobalt-precorrin-5B (C(1))-methyltransferase CbiD [Tepidanaerobacteraceae bacterium]
MKIEKFVVKNGKKLRCGYTTGACAAAASKAAAYMLFHGNVPETVVIDTPKGWPLTLDVEAPKKGDGWAECGVRKDAGDDPDVTHGMRVFARAEKTDAGCIMLAAGEGVGTVTRPGLSVEPGEPAINPVPRAMIIKEVMKVLPEGAGIKITLSIPGGEEVAKNTFNPRLGIEGGLSIIGTTGIVEPMSMEALKDAMALELSMMASQGQKKAVLTPGNYGKNYALKIGVDESMIVSYGNFLGFMLEKAVEYGFEKIWLIGDMGKLIKVAAGIFNTAGRIADARAEIMAAYGAHFGADRDAVDKILLSATTEEAMEIMEKSGVDTGEFCRFVARRIADKCAWYAGGRLKVDVDLISQKRGLLARIRGDEKW